MEFREQITIGVIFFAFACVAGLGFWQLVAAWQGIRAFSVLPARTRPRWNYLLGSLLLMLACLWFFGTRTEDIFSPGPASSEFLFFLFVALLCALTTSIVVSSLLGRRVPTRPGGSRETSPRKELVSIKWWHGALYLPPSGSGPWPAVCAVPEPGKLIGSVETLTAGLACEGIATLVLDLSSPELWSYPDILGAIPQAVGYADRRDDLDASRLGLLGVGLGGDLVIRAGASDSQVKAMVALSPLLAASTVQPGLDLLREMSYPEAIRWRSRQGDGHLVEQLGALDRISELDSRPLLLIQGDRDRLAAEVDASVFPPGVEVEAIAGAGRLELVQVSNVLSSTVSWFQEHL